MSQSDVSNTTRRAFLAASAAAAAGAAIAPGTAGALTGRRRARLWATSDLLAPTAIQAQALAVLGKSSLRVPGSLPNPSLPAGTDTIPQIEHIVVLMMENHSYDNFLGMLGRGPYQLPRGDGFTIAADGYPANSNPSPSGSQRAFHMPTTCQFSGAPTQEWEQCHIQYDDGTNQGFVTSGSGVVSMGYWAQTDLPFTYDLATQFPIGDRYFCSVLGQTDPNRRYLISGTSEGMTDDVGKALSQDASLLLTPPNGTIFSRLEDAGITWTEYAAQYPQIQGYTESLYPTVDLKYLKTNTAPFSQFLTDAAAGTLPAFSFIDPNFDSSSQENPQNIVVGEAFLSQVVQAIGTGPGWQQTILIVNWDEHGGYYDHVPPPLALAPDAIPPFLVKGDQAYDGFHRYGFRVPAIVVSPYAKQNHVSSLVYDHTSMLAFVELKYNLPAMTYRDANANDLTDFLDMDALSAGTPTFPELPALAAPGDTPQALMCSTTGPGTVPPPAPSPLPITAQFTSVAASTSERGIVAALQASRSSLSDVTVALQQGSAVLASRTLLTLSVPVRQVVLRVGGGLPPAGTYTVVASAGGTTLATQTIVVGQ